ncbi:MAG: M24 family metallopeptidase [Armatimonadota bacterium]
MRRHGVLTVLLTLALAVSLAASCLSQPGTSPAERRQEAQIKQERLCQFLEERNFGALLINKVRNFSWITAGGDTHIVITSEAMPCHLLLTTDGGKYLIANGSEAPRVMTEQLAGLGYELKFYPWYSDKAEPNRMVEIVQELTEGVRLASDSPFPGAEELSDGEIAQVRIPLTDTEIQRYRWLGRQCAEAVAETCGGDVRWVPPGTAWGRMVPTEGLLGSVGAPTQVRPGMTEYEMETITAHNLRKRGITPTVLLIAADERIFNYRHAIPTEKKLEHYAMINICARKWGLVIATTRFVYFGDMPDDLREKFEKAAYVDAIYLDSTQPGRTAGEILGRARHAYAKVGYPDEWTLHHQGGAIGYNERDWVTFPGCDEVIHARQAFAWNPTLQGAKIEDTILAFDDRVEVLTELPNWPSVEVEIAGKTYRRPVVLERPMP